MRKMEDPLEVYIARRKNANNEYIYTFHITKPAMTIQFSFTTSAKNDELPSLKRIDTQEGHYISFEMSPTQKRKVTAEAAEVICIDDGSDGSAGGGGSKGGGKGGSKGCMAAPMQTAQQWWLSGWLEPDRALPAV